MAVDLLPWDKGRTLRLIPDGADEGAVVDEYTRLDLLVRAGVPLPEVFGVDLAQGRLGIIEGAIAGQTMLERLSRRPWQAARQGRELGELHLRILRLPPPDGLYGEGPSICHGHFGPSLVILTEHGPVVVGWSEAHRGPPESDVRATLAVIADLRPPPNARLWPLADRAWRRFDRAYRRAVAAGALVIVGKACPKEVVVSTHRRVRRARRCETRPSRAGGTQ